MWLCKLRNTLINEYAVLNKYLIYVYILLYLATIQHCQTFTHLLVLYLPFNMFNFLIGTKAKYSTLFAFWWHLELVAQLVTLAGLPFPQQLPPLLCQDHWVLNWNRRPNKNTPPCENSSLVSTSGNCDTPVHKILHLVFFFIFSGIELFYDLTVCMNDN